MMGCRANLLQQFAADHARGVYWLSRLKVGTVLNDNRGQRIDNLMHMGWFMNRPMCIAGGS